ncbi:glycoside hydrolase [Oscillatoriales cyanobacterium USR001]|nr:glycoside hydrolase [Oscillatoriales cyanobacterium USR001]
MTDYQLSDKVEYQCQTNINIYDSPKCDRLATQAAMGRHLRVILEFPIGGKGETENHQESAIAVQLCEDDYPGWLAVEDIHLLIVTKTPYQARVISATEIRELLPNVIAFTHHAMNQPNHYLWGGTVGPNYDCSGLMQAAWGSVGIWLPRDAYQQEAFTQPIALTSLEPGDLIFFGSVEKATHVGLYLNDGRYIHSSGKELGRNGIGIDILSEDGDHISQTYYRQLRGAGRVVRSYGNR